MEELQKWTQEYGGDEMKPLPLELKEGEKEVEIFFHDESAFHANDYQYALTVNKMNVGPGRNAPKMQTTWIPAYNPHGHANKEQTMQFDEILPDDHPYKTFQGKPKGIKVILEERGLISVTPPGTHASKNNKLPPGECDNCSWSYLSISTKVPPELNPIELFWGWVKQYFREHCNGQFKAARKLLDESLDACMVTTIPRFFRRVFHYMSVYHQGPTGLLAEFVVNKYCSHRGVTATDLAAAKEAKKVDDAKFYEKEKQKAA
ncbi:hypothetical protein M422DRAFT_245596 [Sphaerobolus stellatus SS14]|nr:hypothetical protein M422DRAFT_245596 [Sphaerobolus stellatus SS14]